MVYGRPTDYTPELGEEICRVIASHPYSLRKLCNMYDHWPNPDTIHTWTHRFDAFSDMYLEAKRLQIHAKMEYAHALFEDCDLDAKVAATLVQGQVSLYKWEAQRLLPKLYGDYTYVDQKTELHIHEDTLEHLK